jgi:Carboxypeptidase regulatory-like domain
MLGMKLGSALLILTSAFAAAQQAAPLPDKAQVEGAVINMQTSRGVPWANVVLRRAAQGGRAKSVRADGSGHFLFQQIDPGPYRLTASRAGFFTSGRPGAFQTVVEVAAGQYLKDVLVRVLPAAVVSGQIVDEHNDPLQDASVRVLAREYRSGRLLLSTAGKGITDDRGEYRIYGLRPGSYYVLADYHPERKADKAATPAPRSAAGEATDSTAPGQALGEPAPEATYAYTPLFYPDTRDFLHAQALTAHPGDEVHANFIFFTMPSVSIRGRVVNGLTGAPAEGAEVAAYWTEYLSGEGITAAVDPHDGTFVIRDLAPGLYTLHTTFTEEGQAYTDQRSFEVGVQGIETAVLAGLPDSIVSGRVVVEGEDQTAIKQVSMSFVGPGTPATIRATARVPRMEFITQLHPGDRYAVSALGLPQDYYLRTVRVSGHEVEPDSVVVGARRADLELVISPEGGHIEGVVADLKDQPVSGLVALLPDDKPGTAEAVRRARADSRGRFTLRGVPPGTYKLFAFEDIDLDALVSQPDLVKEYVGSSASILVSESGRYLVQLTRIAADSH